MGWSLFILDYLGMEQRFSSLMTGPLLDCKIFLIFPSPYSPVPFRVFFPMNCADAHQVDVGLSCNCEGKAVDTQEKQPVL